jgi:outer membrane protein
MNEQAVRLGEKIARSNFYPSLTIGGNVISNYNVDQTNINGGKVPVNRQLNDNLGQNIYINLRIPIFSQMENSNQVKKERINISNAQLSIQEAENTVTTNIMQLVNDFNAAKQKYTATLSSSQQNIYSYSMYEEKYKLGLASSLELLTSKDILNASASNYIQAKLELFFKYKLLELVMNYNNNKKVQF